MTLRIRLARFGIKNDPIFRINVAKSRNKRNGKPIETLGYFYPKSLPESNGETLKQPLMFKRVSINFERCRYWIMQGAEPTDTVRIILGKAGILPSLPRSNDAYNNDNKDNFPDANIDTTTNTATNTAT